MTIIIALFSAFILWSAYQITSEYWYMYGSVLAKHFQAGHVVTCNENKSLVVTDPTGGSSILINSPMTRMLVKRFKKEGIISDD